MNSDHITYFDSFEVEYILKDIKKLIGKKNTATDIYRTQANYSTMCGYFCIGFVDFMLKSKC